eukprot:PRCOL_00005059-RA
MRAPSLVVVLVGLPGSGKSTLAAALAGVLGRAHGVRCVSVAADAYLDEARRSVRDGSAEWGGEEGARVWKESRRLAASRVARALDEWRGEGGEGGTRGSGGVVLVDDNHFYRSMRREFYGLCRRARAAFACVHVQASTSACVARDASRAGGARVGEETIARMAAVMEVPDASTEGGPVLSLDTAAEGADVDGFAEEAATWIMHVAWGAAPELLASEDEALLASREADRAATAESALHAADLLCRRAVAEAMRRAPADCNKRAASAALASARKEALAAARLAAQETGFAADAERVAQAFTQRAAEIMAGLNK